MGLKPNYEPNGAEAQLRTAGLKPNYEPNGAEAQLRTEPNGAE
ncbi:hypothetical protein [Spirulina subsalsa]|nr:hypothetical protein [Spirulina subsalsa]